MVEFNATFLIAMLEFCGVHYDYECYILQPDFKYNEKTGRIYKF